MQEQRRGWTGLWIGLLVGGGCGLSVTRGNCSDEFAQNLTDSLIYVVGVETLATYAFGGEKGKKEATQIADSELITGAITTGLKLGVREERPDGSDLKSFPSGHASAGFAWARVLAKHHPKQKWLAYAYTAGVAWSRVKLDRHRVHDVVAGAALGLGCASYSMTHDGIVLHTVRW